MAAPEVLQLEDQQLLEREPAPRELRLELVLREVHRVERGRALRQPLGRAHERGQRLDRLALQRTGALHELAQAIRGDALGGRVDRGQPLRAHVLRGHPRSDLVGGHDEAIATARVGAAVQHDPRARRQLVGHPRLVEPDGLHGAAVVDDRRLDERHASAGAAARDPPHVRDHGRLLARGKRCDRTRLAAVLVAERQVLEQVAERRNAERLERRGGALARPGKRLSQP